MSTPRYPKYGHRAENSQSSGVVARPIADFSTAFTEQLLRTPQAIEQMRRQSKGVTDFRLRLYCEEFKATGVVLTPSSEQIVISEFLDRETAKIDVHMAEQRRLIELLKEERQAVISHAVTKGLGPHAHQLQKMELLTAAAQRAIDLLQERRTALISAAVTGKIDARGSAESEAA